LKTRPRMPLALCAVLAALILWGAGSLVVRCGPKLRLYYFLKIWPDLSTGSADLSLCGADLSHLDLRGFNLGSVRI
jgi:hypothetical protein